MQSAYIMNLSMCGHQQLVQGLTMSWGTRCPAGNWTTRRPPDYRKEMQTAVVWSCFPSIRSGQKHLARHSEGGKKRRQTTDFEPNRFQHLHESLLLLSKDFEMYCQERPTGMAHAEIKLLVKKRIRNEPSEITTSDMCTQTARLPMKNK